MFDCRMKILEVSEYHKVPKMSVNQIFFSLHSAEHVNTWKRINIFYIFTAVLRHKMFIYDNENIEHISWHSVT
jgi:hypothetical protein